MQVPEIHKTEGEKCLSDKQLKQECFQYARINFQGKSFFNKNTGQYIFVSRDGLGEWKTVTKSREQAISIKILDKLLENAIFSKERAPKNRDPNIKKINYFRQDCKINGQMYTAIITVKVYQQRSIQHNSQSYQKYYHHYLDDYSICPKK